MAWMVQDYPEPRMSREGEPVCPVCGRECDTVYRDRYHEIAGCGACVTACDAYETEECYEA